MQISTSSKSFDNLHPSNNRRSPFFTQEKLARAQMTSMPDIIGVNEGLEDVGRSDLRVF